MKPRNDREAITLILEGVVAEGVRLSSVADGEWEQTVSSVPDAVAAATAVTESVVNLILPNGERSWIFFVLGNDPEEVACDYGLNITDAVESVTGPWWE